MLINESMLELYHGVVTGTITLSQLTPKQRHWLYRYRQWHRDSLRDTSPNEEQHYDRSIAPPSGRNRTS